MKVILELKAEMEALDAPNRGSHRTTEKAGSSKGTDKGKHPMKRTYQEEVGDTSDASPRKRARVLEENVSKFLVLNKNYHCSSSIECWAVECTG